VKISHTNWEKRNLEKYFFNENAKNTIVKNTKRRIVKETKMQKKLVGVLRKNGIFFLAPLSEQGAFQKNSRTKIQNIRHWIEMGMLRGAPDILIFDRPPNGGDRAPGTALELKSEGGKLGPEQARVLSHLRERGWLIYRPQSFEEGLDALRDAGYIE